MRRYLVAVSGQPGSGKSTLTKLTRDHLQDAISLHWDDYLTDAELKADLRPWLDDGVDFSGWDNPQFVRDLTDLLQGSQIRSPIDNAVIRPARYIIVEFPAGRLASAMTDLIDVVAFIDVPHEIALARQVLWISSKADSSLGSVTGYLRHYLNCARELSVELHRQVMPTADIVLDGREMPQAIAEELAAYVRSVESTQPGA